MRRWWIAIVLLVGLAAGGLLAWWGREPAPERAAVGALGLRAGPVTTDVREDPEELSEGFEDAAGALTCLLPPLGEIPAQGVVRGLVGEEARGFRVDVQGGAFRLPPELARGELAAIFLELRPTERLIFSWTPEGGCQFEDVRPVPGAAETRCRVDLRGPPPDFTSSSVGGVAARLEGRTLVLSGPESGSGALEIGYKGPNGEADWSYPAVAVSWSPEGCSPVRIGHWATIRGSIANSEGVGEVVIEGCGGEVRAREGRYEMRVEAAACELMASRYEGRLRVYGPAVPVDPRPGARLTVDLAVPDEPVGGLGVSIAEHAEGIAITNVYAGTPADNAGLRAGDVFTAVDGEPAADLTTTGFVTLGTGPVGSAVELEVLRGEERFTVEVIRALIE